jgi:ribosomal small subunit protein bTHX
MGRGDKKTAKGKRFMGSFGVSRPHKTATTAPKAAAAAPAKKATKAKA